MRIHEYPLLSGDEMRYFEARLVKMTQGDVLGMVRDVTDRKRAEAGVAATRGVSALDPGQFPVLGLVERYRGRYLAANRTLAHALRL